MDQVNEAMKVFIKKIADAMVSSVFSYKTDAKMRKEMEEEIENAVAPILKKYGYIVESETKTKTFNEFTKSDR